MSNVSGNFEVNGRDYKMPSTPVIVVCIDGNEPEYLDKAMRAGRAPYFAMQKEKGFFFSSRCHIPSITNPNNISIITGTAPAEHGICGNYYFDQNLGEDVMMTDPDLIRVPTILAAMQKQGRRVAAVTAKDIDLS